MRYEKPFELGWYAEDHTLGSDMELARQALIDGGIDQEWAANGYITITLYPNHMFFVLFRKSKPAKKYFNSLNASVFSIVDGEFTTLYERPKLLGYTKVSDLATTDSGSDTDVSNPPISPNLPERKV